MQVRKLLIPSVLLIAGVAAPQERTSNTVVQATLENGMRVVIVRDPLAPVITVDENYLVGDNETPAGFPGTAKNEWPSYCRHLNLGSQL